MTLSRRSFLGASVAAGATHRTASPAAYTHALDGASAGLVADALRSVGLDPRAHTLSRAIRPVTDVGGAIVGGAVTTRWELARGKAAAGAIRRYVFDPIDRAPPGSIWVVASGTTQLLSMFGDLIAMACQARSMVGAVTDGGCRDTEAMTASGFHVFARGTVLYGPGDTIVPTAANGPVQCGGVSIHPGDAVVADGDGVIVVPRRRVDEVARAARELESKESDVRRRIAAGISLAEAYSLE